MKRRRTPFRAGRLLRAGALLLPAALPAAAPAQEPPPTLEGRLLLAGQPADSGTIVLHQVSPAEGRAVDSLGVGPDGAFRIPLPHAPVVGSGEVFFASHRYEGVLYFGPAIASPDQLEDPYEIRAYPTREAPPGGLELPIHVRNLFIEESPVGWRVTDLFDVRNDSAVTWVPGPGGGPVWTYPLPAGAFALRVAQEDVAHDAVTLEEGRLHSSATVPPGDRLLVVEYEIPSLDLSIPLPGWTEAVELFVREPAPPLQVDGLRPEAPLELEIGSVYRRWAGEDFTDATIRLLPGEDQALPAAWLAVGLALVLALAGSWLLLARGTGRRGPAEPSQDDVESRRRELLDEIARLDEARPPREEEAPDVRRRRDRERARLMERLDEIERARTEGGQGT